MMYNTKIYTNENTDKWLSSSLDIVLGKNNTDTGIYNSNIDENENDVNTNDDKYSSGLSLDDADPNIKNNFKRRIAKYELLKKNTLENFSLADLKAEFPSTWEEVIRAEKVFGKMYDEYFEKKNKMYSTIWSNEELQREVQAAEGIVNSNIGHKKFPFCWFCHLQFKVNFFLCSFILDSTKKGVRFHQHQNL